MVAMRGLVAVSLVIGLGACSFSAEDGPMSRTASDPDSPVIANRLAANIAEPAPVCTSRALLEQNEGRLVRVQGTYRFPIEKAFARNKLTLDDGTTVVLSRPTDETMAARLVESNQGVRMTIRGLIFSEHIPDKYGIIGRTPDPYLLDLDAVEVDPQ
jgi:hypothetical protein